jgi:hypothetical protein
MATRRETAILKFNSTLTEQQQDIMRREILEEYLGKADTMMRDRYNARLYPTVRIPATVEGLSNLMFNYGYYSKQLWKMGEDGKWGFYEYGS